MLASNVNDARLYFLDCGKPVFSRLLRMRKRKLYYVPGLISLLGLPVLLYFLGPQDPAIQTVIKISVPSDDTKPDPPGFVRFTRRNIYRSLKHKKIVSVDLDDVSPDNIDQLYRFRHLKKMDFISNEIGRLQFTHDTSSVFKIEFGDDCTYGDFVCVLNLIRLYNVKRCVFIDDAYYILATPPPQPEPILDLKLDPLDDVVYGPEPTTRNEPSQWEFFKFALAKWWEKAILIIKRGQNYVLGFLLLIIIPTIVRLHKKIFPNPKKTAIFRKTN
jgi:hypothetical protein